jgi:hypothetical protein
MIMTSKYLLQSDVAEQLAQGKLNMRRFPGASGKMVALVAYVLEQEWTRPAIRDLSETSDGFLVAFPDAFLGTVSDFRDNLRRLADVAGLTPGETRVFRQLLINKGLQQTASSWQ